MEIAAKSLPVTSFNLAAGAYVMEARATFQVQ